MAEVAIPAASLASGAGIPLAPATAVSWHTSVIERALKFAAAILRIAPSLAGLGPQYRHIADQLFRSASAIGASLEEAEASSTRREMAHKQSIALREAREAEYWLRLLLEIEPARGQLTPLRREAGELVAILTTSVRKLRQSD